MGRPLNDKERKEKKQVFLEAYDESKGMLTTSCKRAGISPETVYNWRENDKEFDENVKQIKEKWKEWVEGRLMTLIENGNTAATLFFLKCKGGYRETNRIEVEQVNNIDVQAAIAEIKEQMTKGGE